MLMKTTAQQLKQQTDAPFQAKAKNQTSTSGILQRYANVFQLQETEEKSIATKNYGTGYYKYEYDSKGNIENFSDNKATSTPKGKDPVLDGSKVDLDTIGGAQGEMKSGKVVDVVGASRSQHFSIADKYISDTYQDDAEDYERKGKYTWHHLTAPYYMELVDMAVHRSFNHTGGFSLWT